MEAEDLGWAQENIFSWHSNRSGAHYLNTLDRGTKRTTPFFTESETGARNVHQAVETICVTYRSL